MSPQGLRTQPKYIARRGGCAVCTEKIFASFFRPILVRSRSAQSSEARPCLRGCGLPPTPHRSRGVRCPRKIRLTVVVGALLAEYGIDETKHRRRAHRSHQSRQEGACDIILTLLRLLLVRCFFFGGRTRKKVSIVGSFLCAILYHKVFRCLYSHPCWPEPSW